MKKYRLHWTLHPEKDLAWYENEIKTKQMTEDAVARELDINYAMSVSGKVFTPFREDRHVCTKRMTFNPMRPVYRIWDFGKTNAVLYGQQDGVGRKTCLHERILEASTTREQIDAALTDSAELFPGVEFIDICDPAGCYEDHRGESTDVEQLNNNGIYPQFDRIRHLRTNERKKRGISAILRDLQSTPGGGEGFTIYCGENNETGCPTLKKAMQGGYCYKKDVNGNITDRVAERHPYEDIVDNLIYWYLETDTGNLDDDDHAFMYEPSVRGIAGNKYTGF